ncbi:coiled-coil domain-containing protein 93-like [Oncorhynchus mykiss]|uniref:coiled-coil domain-containing protein 93-like n=1 Tax=Oncorhynchus mykiss TaxID=8022 RepID=UPI00187871AC|nr:coiled-coil domain-containing protein 93-like [Oncorhynchus mykiss]
MAATSVFHRARTGSKIGAQYDQEGNLIQAETREDEEQSVKLAEILELLLAAGYFRARIKGLGPFDKENSTIGQKIALTEKIVSVLPKMKCPYCQEPHQIQGLDFIHIFPVIQWLMKRAIETREEMGDYVRAYSVSQFQKTHSFPEDEDFLQRKENAVKDVLEVYKPHRKYKRQVEAGSLLDEEYRVHSTLLEYGRQYGFSKQTKQDQAEDRKALLMPGSQATPPGITEGSQEEEEYLQAAELRIKTLMPSMAAMGRLTASTVGQIVGLQSEEMKQIASEYAEKLERSAEDRPEWYGPIQQHRRIVTSLNKQIQQKTKQLEELQAKHLGVKSGCVEAKSKLLEATEQTERLEKELSALEEAEGQADTGLLEKLRALVGMNENPKHQEQEFQTHCRMVRLQQNIEDLKMESGDDTEDEKERSQLIDKQYNTDRDKLQKIRLMMAWRNREIAILQRKIDEVPSRAELNQYQKRFIELYGQVSATHKETKQFFTLYYTLDDKKVYLEKEVNLLNSIHDNFQQ